MPIAFPPASRGVDYAPNNDVLQRAPDYDITNLGMIGTELSPSSFAPGFPLDFNTSRATNLRNLDYQYEAIDNTRAINIAFDNGIQQVGVYQTDWAASNRAIIGISRDSTGAILGTCMVDLFITGSDALVERITSDASGNFRFGNPGTGPFYLVAYKAGSPDVAGTTVNTLLPALV